MYIVRFGVVEVYANGELVKTCQPGDVFGENALLGLTATGRRNRSAVSPHLLPRAFLSALVAMESSLRQLRL